MWDSRDLLQQALVHLLCGALLAQIVFLQEVVAVSHRAQILRCQEVAQLMEIPGRTHAIQDSQEFLQQPLVHPVFGAALVQHVFLLREVVVALRIAQTLYRLEAAHLRGILEHTHVSQDTREVPQRAGVHLVSGSVLVQFVVRRPGVAAAAQCARMLLRQEAA